MPKTITMRELNEMLQGQEEELSAEFGAKQKALIAENERLSLLLAEKFKVIDDLTERLEKVKTQVKDKIPAPYIVGVLDCSPCMSDPEPQNIISKFDYKNIPCLDESDVCLSCGS
jgi:hypothetical protein